MVGHYIPNTRIAVDVWEELPENKVHFLTTFQATHIAGLTSKWRRKIFTSQVNARFLENILKVNPRFVRGLEIYKWYTNKHTLSGSRFDVVLIPANHCPGSVMLLFEGSFGRILYTGSCRFVPWMVADTPLSPLVESQNLDLMYLDNTYASPGCEFPCQIDSIRQIVKIVKANPGRTILLGVSEEDGPLALTCLAKVLNVRIVVSRQRFGLVQKVLEKGKKCLFTDDPSCSVIHAFDFSSLAKERKKYKSPVTVLLMLKCQFGSRQCVDVGGSDIHVVPYSTHCSHSELVDLVTLLRPRQIVPIVPDSTYSTIPKELYDLCRAPADDASMRKHPQQAVSAGISAGCTSSSEGSSVKQCGIDRNCHSTRGEEMVKFVKKVQGEKLVAGKVNFSSKVIARKVVESRGRKVDENKNVWHTYSGSKASEGVNIEMNGSREPTSESASYITAQTSPLATMDCAPHFSQHDHPRHSDEVAFSEYDLSGVQLQHLLQQSQEKPTRNGVEDSAVDKGDTEQKSSNDEGRILPSMYLLPSRLRHLRCAQRKWVSSAPADSQKCANHSRRLQASIVTEKDDSGDGQHPCPVLLPAHRAVVFSPAVSQAGKTIVAEEDRSYTDFAGENIRPDYSSRVPLLKQACAHGNTDDVTKRPSRGGSTIGIARGGAASRYAASVNNECDSPHTVCQVGENCSRNTAYEMEEFSQSDFADLISMLEHVQPQLHVSVCLAKNTNRNFLCAAQQREPNCWTTNYNIADSDCVYSNVDADAYIKTISSSSVCKGDYLVGTQSYQPQSSVDGDSQVPTRETRNQINGSFRTVSNVSVPLRRDSIAGGGHDVGVTFLPTSSSTMRKYPAVHTSVNGSQFSNADILTETPECGDPQTRGKCSKLSDGVSVRQECTAAMLCHTAEKRLAVVKEFTEEEECDKSTTKLSSKLKRLQPKQKIPCQTQTQSRPSPLKRKRKHASFEDTFMSSASTDSRAKKAMPEVCVPTKPSSSGRCEEREYCADTVPVDNFWNTSDDSDIVVEDCVFTVPTRC